MVVAWIPWTNIWYKKRASGLESQATVLNIWLHNHWENIYEERKKIGLIWNNLCMYFVMIFYLNCEYFCTHNIFWQYMSLICSVSVKASQGAPLVPPTAEQPSASSTSPQSASRTTTTPPSPPPQQQPQQQQRQRQQLPQRGEAEVYFFVIISSFYCWLFCTLSLSLLDKLVAYCCSPYNS